MDSALTLGRVTVRASDAGDSVHRNLWRWQVADAVNRVSAVPAGLPPQSILIVRQLADPAPGALLGESAPRWGRAAQAALDDCLRSAVRPVYESVPVSANAVWFADPAEWLACLSWDVFTGVARSRWWWQAWLRRGSDPPLVFRLWQEEARWVPPTVALLDQLHGESARALLMAIPPAQSSALRRQVAAIYGLPDVRALTISKSVMPSLPRAQRALVADLPEETAALVALSLAIVTAPAALRSLRRGAPVGHASDDDPAWQILDGNGRLPDESQAASEPPARTFPDGESPQAESNSARADAQREVDFGENTWLEQVGSADLSLTFDPIVEDDAAEPKQTLDSTGASVEPVDAEATRVPSDLETGNTDPVADASTPDLATSFEHGIHTQLGGLWYLVNVLAALDWLDAPQLESFGPWRRLMVLGRVLLGDVPDDPVWPLLASLADDDLDEALAGRWLAAAMPEVRRYLEARLEDPAAFIEALGDPAVLYVTRTHIDVVFTLEQIRLDLRASGLDVDPGWIPALARVVSFHYE